MMHGQDCAPLPPGVIVRLARDAAETGAAYELAARVFGPNYYEARDAKRILVAEVEPMAGPADAIVALAGDAVVGFIRLVSRRVRFGTDMFPVTGITSVAVTPECRGKHVGSALMRMALREGRRRGDDLAVLFARRAVDGWYPQFGFLGIGQHVECRLGAETRAVAAPGRPTVVAGFDPAAVDVYAAAYRRTYRGLPGHFLRTPEWWRRAARRLDILKSLQFVTLVGSRRAPIGYAVLDGHNISELAVRVGGGGEALGSVIAYLRGQGHHSCVLRVHPAHPETAGVFATNHTMAIRRAWDGGHMVASLHQKATRRLRAHGITTAAPRRRLDPTVWPVWSPLDEF